MDTNSTMRLVSCEGSRQAGAEQRLKELGIKLGRSNIGLDWQDAKFGEGNQNKSRKAVGRYCSEYKRFHDLRIHYSITVSVADMSSWPSPQKTSQKNVNLPILSGTKRTFSTTPGWISARS